jgi:hypothetical protein
VGADGWWLALCHSFNLTLLLSPCSHLRAFCLPGMVLRCAVYCSMYVTFLQPRAPVWQLYAVTAATYYCCQGQAFLLSQLLSPNAAQLTAAVSALINALVASKGSAQTVSVGQWR